MILQRNTAFVRNQSVMFNGTSGLENEVPISLQRPLSSIYRGVPLSTNGKRKTVDSKEQEDEDEAKERKKLIQLSNAMSESGLEKGLRQAIEETEKNEKKKNEKDTKESEKVSKELLEGLKDTNLNSLYRRQVLRDMNKRLRIDSDYNATKFPNATKELFKE